MSFFLDRSAALMETSAHAEKPLLLGQQPLADPILASEGGRAGQSLLFVDSSIADYQQLVAGVAAETEVHVLNPVQDAVTQITNVLLGREGISSLHIVSHGEAGGLDFGDDRLNLGNLPGYVAQLQSWGKALTDDADILLYGCNVAQGELGQTFVQILSQLTGADVAASDDLTGNAALSGNWNLEFSTGSIEAGLAFSQSVQAAYTGILPTFVAAGSPVAVGTNPQSIAFGDFNGDGKLDFATANFGSNDVSIGLGDGSGGFTVSPAIPVGTLPFSVALGDFNGDGKLDFAAANYGSNTVSIGLGDGSGGFTVSPAILVGTQPSSVALGDFNGDGKLDFATANRLSNDVSIGLGNGSGGFTVSPVIPVGTNPISVTLGDFNGDGKLDFATANFGSNDVSVLLNTSPFVTLPPIAAAYTEDSTPIALTPLATFSDGVANLDGGNLTATLTTGGSADDRLSILSTGGITLNGRIVSYLGNAIGTYSQLSGYGSSNPLVVNFNTANATPAAVQALLRAIAFSNTSQDPSTAARTLNISIFNGTESSNTATQTITVTATPDVPVVGTPTVLYTPNGTSPGTQGWAAVVLPGASETPSAGSINLNTTSPFATYAGYGRVDIPLDRVAGYTLNFTAQVPISTTAASAEKNGDSQPDRAGFSVILVNSDLKAIELGFLANRIFAQEDGTRQSNPSLQAVNPGSPTSTLFTQAESVLYNTATLTNYSLTVQGNTYTLAANGTVILTGNLRDYSAAPSNPPIPNPYIVPNTIFFGDDTTSAAASVNLGAISITGAAPISVTVLEDTPTTIPSLDLSGLNLSGSITATVTSILGTIAVNPNIPGGVPSSNITNNGTGNVTLTGSFSQLNTLLIGSGLTYQGNPNVNGSDSLTLTVSGTGLPTGPLSKTIPITIVPVNDRPSFTLGADPIASVPSNPSTLTTFSIPNFTSFNPGAANEAVQTATYTIVSNSNPNLFAFQPTIAPDGTLTYTVGSIASAQTATIAVQVQDNGGTANGGVDTSTTQSFTITVNPIGQPPVTPPVTPPITPPVTRYTAYDYDGDGIADLLITRANYPIKGFQPTTNTFSLRLSSNTVLEIASLTSNFQLVGTGDFNGDGKTDLLWRNLDNNTYSNWFLNGNTYIGGDIISVVASNFELIGTGDYNGDGKADLLWKDTSSNTYSNWFLNGNAYIGGGTIATLPANFQLVSTGDYNGDGKADLLWKDTSSNTYSNWFLDGNAYIGGGTIATLPANFQLVSTGDFNGDGKADLLWKDTSSNTYSNWFLDGSIYVGGGTIATLPANFEVVSCQDYNGDGKGDLLWLNKSNRSLSLWFLDGFTFSGGAEVGALGANEVVRG